MNSIKFDIYNIGDYIARLLTKIEDRIFVFERSNVHVTVIGCERWGYYTAEKERVIWMAIEKEYAKEEYNEVTDYLHSYTAYDHGVCLDVTWPAGYSDDSYINMFRRLDKNAKDYGEEYRMDKLKNQNDECAHKYSYILKLPEIMEQYCLDNNKENLSEEELEDLFDYFVDKLKQEKKEKEQKAEESNKKTDAEIQKWLMECKQREDLLRSQIPDKPLIRQRIKKVLHIK